MYVCACMYTQILLFLLAVVVGVCCWLWLLLLLLFVCLFVCFVPCYSSCSRGLNTAQPANLNSAFAGIATIPGGKACITWRRSAFAKPGAKRDAKRPPKPTPAQ